LGRHQATVDVGSSLELKTRTRKKAVLAERHSSGPIGIRRLKRPRM
jgi:hypothetical protein